MARIPDDVLARFKAEVSVQRLVEGVGVVLRRQGNDLVGACPFHEDTTPSLVVSPGKNLWHCLGACQAGGGPVDWVMTAQGVSFRRAVELLVQESPALSSLAPGRPGSSVGRVKRSTAGKLTPLAAPDAEDVAVLERVVAHYADTPGACRRRLTAAAASPGSHPLSTATSRTAGNHRTRTGRPAPTTTLHKVEVVHDRESHVASPCQSRALGSPYRCRAAHRSSPRSGPIRPRTTAACRGRARAGATRIGVQQSSDTVDDSCFFDDKVFVRD